MSIPLRAAEAQNPPPPPGRDAAPNRPPLELVGVSARRGGDTEFPKKSAQEVTGEWALGRYFRPFPRTLHNLICDRCSIHQSCRVKSVLKRPLSIVSKLLF